MAIINLVDTFSENYKRFMALDEKYQRVRYFHSRGMGRRGGSLEGTISSVLNDDDKICFTVTKAAIKFQAKPYPTYKKQFGFTYDKKSKKISVWFNKGLGELKAGVVRNENSIMCLFVYLKMDWYLNMSESLRGVITKTLLEKMLSGRITNPEDYIKMYISTSIRHKAYHWRKIRDIRQLTSSHSYYFDTSTQSLIDISRYTTNPNECLSLIKRLHEYDDDGKRPPERIEHLRILTDVLEECRILNKKINPQWSLNRLKEEHTRFSREVTSIMIETKSNTKIEYENIPTLPDGIKLLTTEAKVFGESQEMSHCIYTSYWQRIETKRYFAFSVTSPVRATIGIHRSTINRMNNEGDTFTIDQMYGPRNSRIADEVRNEYNQLFASEEWQNFFRNNQPLSHSDSIRQTQLEAAPAVNGLDDWFFN